MAFDIWMCRVAAWTAIIIGAVEPDWATMPREHYYTSGVILICTSLVIGHMRDRK